MAERDSLRRGERRYTHAVQFGWNPRKAALNLARHGVDVAEAQTAFADPLETTIPDPDHSVGEHRFLSIGRSAAGGCWLCPTLNGTSACDSSARVWPRRASAEHMNPSTRRPDPDEMRPEYDFSSSKAVRGKHFRAYQAGTNVVLIEPDLVEAFPDSDSVNQAPATEPADRLE